MAKRNVPVTKNQVVTITINDIGTEGQGIGRYEGYTLFVRGALPGEEVSVKVIKVGKNFGYGIIEGFIQPSKDRVEPICPVANQCGGCSLQHLSYEGQLKYKTSQVQNLMERVAKLPEVSVLSTLGMQEPYEYRNKVQYPIRRDEQGFKIGYYAKKSHRIVTTGHCYIEDQRNKEIRDIVEKWMTSNQIEAYNEETHKGIVRHLVTRVASSTKNMHVTLVINAKKVKAVDELIESLKDCGYVIGFDLNINRDKTNVIMSYDQVHIWGEAYLEDTIGDLKFHISPLSFYQVNPIQTEVLYNKALKYAGLTGQETVLDLYCGIGTISLFLAQKAKKVIGVEIVPAAIDNARHNAEINGINNADFYVGKAEVVIPRLYKEEGIKADVIVVDPPRKGCDETLLETMVKIAPNKIVYVSCDPATLARDINYLSQNDYSVEAVQPVDMFPHTTHVECVVGIQRQDITK